METEKILIRRARIIDPSRQLDRVGDLLLGGGEILAAGRLGGRPHTRRLPDHRRPPVWWPVLALSTCTATSVSLALSTKRPSPPAPGLRPKAASPRYAACPTPSRPSTMPRWWTSSTSGPATILWCAYCPSVCVTKGRKGQELAEMEELASAGVVAFSDDGDPVYDANLMRLALTYSSDLGLAYQQPLPGPFVVLQRGDG